MTISRFRTIWYRVVATAVPIVVVINTLVMPAGAQTSGFGDVPDDAYFATPVADLHAEGVFNDTLCDEGFCPGVPIDRRTMAVWTIRVLDGQDPSAITQSRFDDVDPTSYHAPFIERMAELRVTRGCGDSSRFCPDRNVTRAEMAAFLSRAFNLLDAANPGFDDVPDGAWYASDVAKLAASGITVGCGANRFCPDRNVTRGEMATFLHRANERHKRIESIRYSPSDDTAESTGQLTLGHEVQQGTALCLQPPVPTDLSDHVVILRIESNGCLTVTYEPLNGRTLQDVRREYVSDPDVIAIDLVQEFVQNTSVQGSRSSDWHYKAIDAHKLNEFEWPNGTNIEVAIVDGGIDADHVELRGRVIAGYGLISLEDSLEAELFEGKRNGHGTFIAGLIGADPDNEFPGKGVAPEAILSSYKTFSYRCSIGICVGGIETALTKLKENIESYGTKRTVIVNMSFGGYFTECSSTYILLVKLLNDYPNVVLIASAGNDKKDLAVELHYPSGCPNVLEVAASNDDKGTLATGWWSKTDKDHTAGSNYGPEVVIAPGEDLTSLQPGDGEVRGSGTSYAAPLVAGVAAHLKAWFPEATGLQIIDAIQKSASHGSSPEEERGERGYGFIRPLEAIKYLDGIFNKNVFCKFEPGTEGCELKEDPTMEVPMEEDPMKGDPIEVGPIDDFPVVRLEVGNSAEGAKTDSGPCSALCRYLRVEINDEAALSRELGPGPYTLACAHNGAGGFSRGVYADADEDVSVWPSTNDCFFGFPGSEVFVIVGAEHRDGTWYGGIYSNTVVWPNCTVKPDRCPVPDEVPDRPTVRATVDETTIEASWSADDNGLRIDRWEISGDEVVSANTTSYEWTNQQPGSYRVRVRAHNQAGWSEWGTSNTVTVTDEADDEVPPDRPTVRATVDGTTIVASWSADDNGSRIDKWEIRGRGEVSASTTSGEWTNQQPGSYRVRVRAHNQAGWSEWGTSNRVTVTDEADVVVPDRPTVRATVDGTTIVASWFADDNGSRIDKWEVSGPGVVSANTTSYEWTNLQLDSYHVMVRAHNQAGWSEWGTSNTVTTYGTVAYDAGSAVGNRWDWDPSTASHARCQRAAICRNIGVSNLSDFSSGPPYQLECWYEGDSRADWSGPWSGAANSGCYFGTSQEVLTVYVKINGVESNRIVLIPPSA